MRGDTAPLTWDGSTGVTFANIGGDYWKAVVSFPANAHVQYKLFTNASSATGDNEHKGWENDINPNVNRELQLGSSDMVVPVQFVNGSADRQLADWKPWTIGSDSIAVWVRVNMQGWEAFNPATDMIGVRGAAWPGYLGNLSWAHTLFLTRENPHGNGGSRQYNADNFYSGCVKIPRDSVTAGQAVEYKFVIMNGSDPDADPKKWEDISNRSFKIPYLKGDTTIFWAWFNNTAPVPFSGNDTITINYKVDLTKAIQSRGFKTGDTITVQTGWNASGRDLAGNSPTRTILTKQGFTNTYVATETIISKIGNTLYYQYYVTKEGQDVRETFYNYDYTGSDNTLAERRAVTVPLGTLNVEDILDSKTDMHRMPQFRNTQVLSRNVTVYWEVDMRPAWYQVEKGDTLFDIQGTDHIFKTGTTNPVYPDGVWMNGPATGGWTTWGLTLREDLPKAMYDDATHGDLTADDHIYTVTMLYSPDSTGSKKYIGQEFKFGCHGSDNEGGRGGFGNNHYENIDDSQSEVRIRSQFGSINPKYYDAWDYDNEQPMGVEQLSGAAESYRLDANYPNPFNPSTTITYAIRRAGHVTLKVYDMFGREVASLVNGYTPAGEYRATFDARSLTSGSYTYELRVDGFAQSRKMMLVK
jgi:hypothetical protein